MSINVTNFSIGLGDTIKCTSLVDFSVDVTDELSTITTSGTYFEVNGDKVTTTLTPITDGYNLNYSTVPSGSMIMLVNASNSNNDITTEMYELSYGYEVEWEKVNYWEPNKEIAISVTAKNEVKAANTTCFSTFFKTRRLFDNDLRAEITAAGSGAYDIMSSITPQSKYFFHGHTYSVTISGIKDYSGNILPPKTYSFTIED